VRLPGLLLNAIAGLTIFVATSHAHADTVRLAVASNFIAPAKALAKSFQAKTSHQVKVSYGSSGKLFAQISQGAPFDIFLSADQEKPSKLVAGKLAAPDSQFSYAQGQLVLVSHKAIGRSSNNHLPGINNATALKAALESGAINKLALANPKLAPYGKAAQQYLQQQGLWQPLTHKFVFGENIAQTYQFVYSGNAEYGLVARSQLKSEDDHWLIPVQDYPEILQDAVLLQHAQDNMAAHAFMDFLKSPQSKELIRSYGYHTDGV